MSHVREGEDTYTLKYGVSTHNGNGKVAPFTQIISVNTLVTKFSSLEKDRRICVNDAKSIRTALCSN